jgi:hypothetical protein
MINHNIANLSSTQPACSVAISCSKHFQYSFLFADIRMSTVLETFITPEFGAYTALMLILANTLGFVLSTLRPKPPPPVSRKTLRLVKTPPSLEGRVLEAFEILLQDSATGIIISTKRRYILDMALRPKVFDLKVKTRRVLVQSRCRQALCCDPQGRGGDYGMEI